jgi:predicted transcriptional regulator
LSFQLAAQPCRPLGKCFAPLNNERNQVLAALVGHAIHRVYVTNAKGAPVSIITLTDVLRLVTKA